MATSAPLTATVQVQQNRGFEDLELAKAAVAATLNELGEDAPRPIDVSLVYNSKGRRVVVELGAKPISKERKAKLLGKKEA